MKTKLFSLVAALSLLAVLLWLSNESSSAEQSTEQATTSKLNVSAIKVVPSTVVSSISAFGIAKARWPLNVISPVAGKIVQLAPELEPGQQVSTNTLLAGVLDTAYQYELSSAQARLAQAKLELARYQHEQYVAKQVNGKQKLSAYGRFEPHVAFATAELAAAKAQVNFSQQRLTDTKIRAPFNAIILEKHITPSQWINEGDVLFSVAATNFIDIDINIADSLWQRLNISQNSLSATVTAPSGQTWPAQIRYLKPTLNPQTRQRGLVLEVAKPYQTQSPLLPEQQVNVSFETAPQTNVVSAPATVLTPDNKVWSVVNNQLMLEAVEIIEEQASTVKFRYLNQPQQARTLVLFPLSSMLAGQAVTVELPNNTLDGE